MIETEELDGNRLDQLRRGPAIGTLCVAKAVIVVDYTDAGMPPTAGRFAVASSEGKLRQALKEVS